MTIEAVLWFFENYGFLAVLLLAFSEYLNIPIIPGGVVLPAAGVLIKLGYADFWLTVLSVSAAGLVAELALYGVSYIFSDRIRRFCLKRKKTASLYKKTTDIIDKHGSWGLFVARLIPILRSFVSIPAGLLGMKLPVYTAVSAAGNICYVLWNIALGYFLSSFFIL
jgi:membrane protein DedA with SNARE-associated domain